MGIMDKFRKVKEPKNFDLIDEQEITKVENKLEEPKVPSPPDNETQEMVKKELESIAKNLKQPLTCHLEIQVDNTEEFLDIHDFVFYIMYRYGLTHLKKYNLDLPKEGIQIEENKEDKSKTGGK